MSIFKFSDLSEASFDSTNNAVFRPIGGRAHDASYALDSGDFYSVSEGVPEAENMELHAVNAKRKSDN